MILGYHIILSAYGFWLPNDPRGSWSATVWAFELLAFGSATKVSTTASVADNQHDVALRMRAKSALSRLPVRFNGEQARAIARGFATAAIEGSYHIHALSILPDHVHLVVARHARDVGGIATHLKSKATLAMSSEGIHPCGSLSNGRRQTPWARNYWAPFIRSKQHMRAAIEYVRNNPIKMGLKEQRWKLVVPYG
jgi:REP element-mobilizing transposase RayT